jgi:hypothetical protein
MNLVSCLTYITFKLSKFAFSGTVTFNLCFIYFWFSVQKPLEAFPSGQGNPRKWPHPHEQLGGFMVQTMGFEVRQIRPSSNLYDIIPKLGLSQLQYTIDYPMHSLFNNCCLGAG